MHLMNVQIIPKSCEPRKRCGDWRTCPRCAALRQAHVADRAEALERQFGQLQFTVIKPEENTAAEIRRIKASLLRRTLIPAGIWTIETGEKFNGLHINMITPPGQMPEIKRATTYTELIRTTARVAAAYATKQSGMPSPDQYEGRLFGQFQKVSDILVNRHMPPVAAAAAIEQQMRGKIPIDTWTERERAAAMAPIFPMFKQSGTEKTDETAMEEYEKKARRHLYNLYHAAEAAKNQK